MDLTWYLRRLRAMTPSEVAQRATVVGRRLRWRVGGPPRAAASGAASALPNRSLASLEASTGALPTAPVALGDDGAREQLLAAADELLAGRWPVLGAVRTDVAAPDWWADGLGGPSAPGGHAFSVPYHDRRRVGSVKHIWELARQQHVTVLAAAYRVTGDERYAVAAARQVRSWWAANPPMTGVNWTSPMEAAVRLVTWAWARRLLDGTPAATDLFTAPEAQDQLHAHQRFIVAFPSKGSSANNHLLTELAGVFVATCAFPWWPESDRWRAWAAHGLEVELPRQTFPSGLNRELATGYHCWVLEVGLVAAFEGALAGHALGPGAAGALAAMADATAALADAAGNLPRQGDGDASSALVLDAPPGLVPGRVLSLAAAVVGPRPWWPPVPHDVRAAAVVTTATLAGVAPPAVPGRPGVPPTVFPDAGLVLLRGHLGEDEVWCRFDSGPFGYLTIAAHAHADALAVEVRHDGVDVVADPGNYCYEAEPEWRRYFRSTRAHATVEVGGQDQAEQWGAFLWAAHADAELVRLALDDDGRPSATGRHGAYRRLAPPVDHERAVTLDEGAGAIVVTDVLRPVERASAGGAAPSAGDGDADIDVDVVLSFPLGPTVELTLLGATAHLTWPGRDGRQREAVLELPDTLTWSAVRGRHDPPSGWYSPEFGVRVPAWSLQGSGRVKGPIVMVSVLRFTR